MIKRPYSQSLRGKISNRVLLIGLLPVLVFGSVGYFGTSALLDSTESEISKSRTSLLDDVISTNLSFSALGVVQELDGFMLERISDVLSWASAPTVVRAARNGTQIHINHQLDQLSINEVESQFQDHKSLDLFPEVVQYLQNQLNQSPHFGEIFFTDVNGFNVAMTNPTSDFVQSDESWWTSAFQNGISVGEVEYDRSAGIWSVDLSARIADPSGEPWGVMKAVLGVSLIQEVANLRASEIEKGNISVVNSKGELLAETRSGHSLDRIMNPQVTLKQSTRPGLRNLFSGDQVGYFSNDSHVFGYAKSAGADFYQHLVTGFPGFDWTIMVEQDRAEAFSPLERLSSIVDSLSDYRRSLLLTLIVVSVMIASIALTIAGLLSKAIINPIFQLQELAERVARGDTKRAIRVDSNDEIEDLAKIFDRMRTSIDLLIKRYLSLKQQESRK